MADVKKVVEFESPEQFAEMGKQIVGMSKHLPMAARDIAAIVASGGQAGLARDELTRFAEDAVKMGVAFDQTADESGTMMAKWRTSFRMGQKEVVDLADKINFLSNNGAATAKQISSIVTNIGPLGEVAGLASGEIAAMGATLAGIGISEDQAATGMKNFMLAMTAGNAATNKQKQVFKALRLDAEQISIGMQQDAKGTMLKVMQAISQVDTAKQAGVLQQLFGKESITAISPMLTNLDLLKKYFDLVADETQYAGSMQAEFKARAATTANSMQLLRNRVAALGITVGNILLPAVNEFLEFAGPIVDWVTDFAGANPWLIKGLVGAAIAFGALRLSVFGVAVAAKVLAAVMATSPVGLIVRGIAVAAGFLIANWSSVGPWFRNLWAGIKGYANALWIWLKDVFFNWHPLGLIIANWQPISEWFRGLWAGIKGYAGALWSWLKDVFFNWTPLGLVIANWQPISEWFAGLWEGVKTFANSYWSWLKEGFFSWTPLGLVIANWQPISEWFAGLWEGVKAFANSYWSWLKEGFFSWTPLGLVISNWQPILDWFKQAWETVKGYIEPILNGVNYVSNAVSNVGSGISDAASGAWNWTANALGFGDEQEAPPALASAPVPLYSQASTAKLDGELVVRFENAPQGMRADPIKTNQPALRTQQNVGYRSLAGAG
jgi:TP901 family phage tail tape measure protein